MFEFLKNIKLFDHEEEKGKDISQHLPSYKTNNWPNNEKIIKEMILKAKLNK